jgi:hypothetical protein
MLDQVTDNEVESMANERQSLKVPAQYLVTKVGVFPPSPGGYLRPYTTLKLAHHLNNQSISPQRAQEGQKSGDFERDLQIPKTPTLFTPLAPTIACNGEITTVFGSDRSLSMREAAVQCKMKPQAR